MRYWISRTIKSKWIELFNIMLEDGQLGIRILKSCHLSLLLSKLDIPILYVAWIMNSFIAM